jgi:hypothetical protein
LLERRRRRRGKEGGRQRKMDENRGLKRRKEVTEVGLAVSVSVNKRHTEWEKQPLKACVYVQSWETQGKRLRDDNKTGRLCL